MPERDPLITLKQAATFLSVSESTIRRLVRSGDLPALKVRNQYRFEQRDLDDVARTSLPREAQLGGGHLRPQIPDWAENQVAIWAAGLGDLLSDTKGVHAIVVDRRGSKAFSLLEPPGFRWGVNLWHSSGIDVLTDDQLKGMFGGREVVIFDEMVQRGSDIRHLKDRLTGLGISCRSLCLIRRRAFFETGQLGDPDIEALDDLDDPDFFEAAAFLSRLFDYCEPPLDPEHILVSGYSESTNLVDEAIDSLRPFGEPGVVWDDNRRTDSSIFAFTLDRPSFFDTDAVQVPEGISVRWDGSCKIRVYVSYESRRLTCAFISYPTLSGDIDAWNRLVRNTSARYSSHEPDIKLEVGDPQSEREIERAYLDVCTDFAVELLRQATQAGLLSVLGLKKIDQVANDHVTAFFGKRRGKELANQIRSATAHRGQITLPISPENRIPTFVDPDRSLVEVPDPTRARQALLNILPHGTTTRERRTTALTYSELMRRTRPHDELTVSLALDGLIDGVGAKPVEVIVWEDDFVTTARGYTGTEFGEQASAVSAVHTYDAQAVRRTIAIAVAALEQWLGLLKKDGETEITVAKLLVNIQHDWGSGVRPLAIEPYANKHGLMPGLRTDEPYIEARSRYLLNELVRLRYLVEVEPGGGKYRLRQGVEVQILLEGVGLTGGEKAHLGNLVSTYAKIQETCKVVRRQVGNEQRGQFRDPLVVLSSVRNAKIAFKSCLFEVGDWIQLGRNLFRFLDSALDSPAIGPSVKKELRREAIEFAQAAAFLDTKLAMYEAVPKLREDISKLANSGLYTAEVLLDSIDPETIREEAYSRTDTPIGLLEWAVTVMRPLSSMIRQTLSSFSLVADERTASQRTTTTAEGEVVQRDVKHYADQLAESLVGLLPSARIAHVSNELRTASGDRHREREAISSLDGLFEEVVRIIRGRIKDEPEVALERLRADRRHGDLIKAARQFEAHPDLSVKDEAAFIAVGDFYNFVNLAVQFAAWMDVTEAVVAERLQTWLAESVEEVQAGCTKTIVSHLAADNCVLACVDSTQLLMAIVSLNEKLALRIATWDTDVADRLSWMRFGLTKVGEQMFQAVIGAYRLADQSRLPRGSIILTPEMATTLPSEFSERLTAHTTPRSGEVFVLSND
jgi:excisionase family DNA binding protein